MSYNILFKGDIDEILITGNQFGQIPQFIDDFTETLQGVSNRMEFQCKECYQTDKYISGDLYAARKKISVMIKALEKLKMDYHSASEKTFNIYQELLNNLK